MGPGSWRLAEAAAVGQEARPRALKAMLGPAQAATPAAIFAVWPYLLLFGVALDASTTYFVLMRGFGELNPLAVWLIRAVGVVPAVAVVSAASAAMGLLLLASRLLAFRAIGVAYAATRWIPGVHNALLLHGVVLNPYYTLAVQYVAMLGIYLYFMARFRRRAVEGISES